MPPFFVEYYCPRQSSNWQRWGAGLLSRAGKAFLDFGAAQSMADSLIWQYHAARVVDRAGVPLYQV